MRCVHRDKKLNLQSKKFIFLGLTYRQRNMATATKIWQKKVQKSQNPMGNQVLNFATSTFIT
jgi:hypothetical protein